MTVLPGGVQVDYSRRGEVILVSEDIPPQTILYSVQDVFGEMVHFTQEAERYIRDSRRRKSRQAYVLRYMDRIPLILREPGIVIVDPEDIAEKTLLYYREIYIPDTKRYVLFTVVVKRDGERIVYNFYPQETGKVKAHRHKPPPRVVYLKPRGRRKNYF